MLRYGVARELYLLHQRGIAASAVCVDDFAFPMQVKRRSRDLLTTIVNDTRLYMTDGRLTNTMYRATKRRRRRVGVRH